MRAIWLAALFAAVTLAQAEACGPEGHSIVAETAQARLTPQALAAVDRLLGHGRSLASVASWADDIREDEQATTQWHFVDLPIDANQYDPASQCKPSDQ